MPEGDTIARIARALREVLVGKRIVRLASRMPALRDTDLEGRLVTGIEARGKHLLIAFDDGRTLHTHLRMSGTWRIHVAPYEARSPVVALETDAHTAILYQRARGAPPIVRLLSRDALRREPTLRALGPDLLSTTFDMEEAVRRFRASRGTLGEALLDQRCVAGIGNEYKSEICFIQRVHPHTRVSDVQPDTWRSLLSCAKELMEKNVKKRSFERVTRFAPGPKQWVYGRAGKHCLRCKVGLVRRSFDGLARRVTFWCPECQPN
jgi:endonuclease-8